MLKDLINFERSEERKAIADDYCIAMALLDERFLSVQITPEQHQKGHEYAWHTMLKRCSVLAETYRTREPSSASL